MAARILYVDVESGARGGMNELLTTQDMADADRRAVAAGVPSLTLMENAGRRVAEEAAKLRPVSGRIAVLCGPGNNGGDGFVAARHLKGGGHDVRVHLLGAPEALKGDAAEMARRWGLPIRPATPDSLQSMNLVVDALFGAGLTRPLEGAAAQLVEAVNASGIPVLAVDVPSGLNGTTGVAEGAVVQATRTVTFFRKKPGHVLLPGRLLCGETIVADIGIPESVLVAGEGRHPAFAAFENTPGLWLGHFPRPRLDGHKYGRGHAVVVSGPAHQTGAARLGARAALRIGAGLVTVAGPSDSTVINAAHLTAIMLKPFGGPSGLAAFLSDRRINAVLIGPGAGVGEETRALVDCVLAQDCSVVLDADALTSFAAPQAEPEGKVAFGFTGVRPSAPAAPELLFAQIRSKPDRAVVMTPHEGEFARLFPETLRLPSKLERAKAAAVSGGGVVVLKGADSVIASPDGRAAINANAPATLATAGSGDVLAGFIAGLLAQKMPAFEAALAAVWLHGEAANAFGPGLIAEDLPETLPKVLSALR